MLEQVNADFALASLAERLGDRANAQRLFARSRQWRNLFNAKATPQDGSTVQNGFIQNRNADGTWPKFDAESDDGFVEGSGAQYLWMLPFDAHGLVEMLGGAARAGARLDAFFHDEDGGWALTGMGALHAEMDNEPSVAAPWLYLFTQQPWKTQATVRETMKQLWRPTPDGIPGNDDLGEMSSWYVWSALGMYPLYPGRADLVLASPLFTHAEIRRKRRHDRHRRAAGRDRRLLRAAPRRRRQAVDESVAAGEFPRPRRTSPLRARQRARARLGERACRCAARFSAAVRREALTSRAAQTDRALALARIPRHLARFKQSFDP